MLVLGAVTEAWPGAVITVLYPNLCLPLLRPPLRWPSFPALSSPALFRQGIETRMRVHINAGARYEITPNHQYCAALTDIVTEAECRKAAAQLGKAFGMVRCTNNVLHGLCDV